MNKHSPPPWKWEFNSDNNSVRLVSRNAIHATYVMDFVRRGMQGATPRFIDDNLMKKAGEFASVVTGREHHANWFKAINHPDAILIQEAPNLLKELQHLVRLLEPLEQEGSLDVPGLATLNGARAAIAKATTPL